MIPFIIFIGIALRLFLAIYRQDLVWPDEHFQTLEPASQIVFGYSFQTWEWLDGFRNWVAPTFFTPPLFISKLSGFNGGSVPLILSRTWMVLLSVPSLVLFQKLLQNLGLQKKSQWLGLGLYAFWIPMIFWSVTTLTDHAALLLFWALAPFLVRDFFSTPKPLLWGVLLAVPVLVRPQMIVMSTALVLFYFVKTRSFKNSLQLCVGVLLVLGFYGWIDRITWGSWFLSLKNQIFYGFEKSNFYGTSPFWDYPIRIAQDLGYVVPLAACALTGCRFYKKQIDQRLGLLILPCLTLFLFYSSVAHKETRFMLPILPLFFVLIAWGMDPWIDRIVLPKLLWVPGVLVVLFVLIHEIRNRPIYLTSVNISKLENAIYQDSRKAPLSAQDCVLLLNHNWSWTRGSLGIGSPARFSEHKLEQLTAVDMRNCKYAIIPQTRVHEFRGKTAAARVSFESLNVSQNQFSVFKLKP